MQSVAMMGGLTIGVFAGVGVLEGPMYAVGGHDGWSYLTTVERWDPQTKMWSYVAPMSTARSTVGVAVLGNKLVNIAHQCCNILNIEDISCIQ